MLFNSFDFLVFFPLVVALYFALAPRFRWPLLLIASYVFYAWWRYDYLLLIVASTLVDYVAGLRMGRHERRAERRPWLALSLCSNLGLLFAFKYFNFFAGSLGALMEGLGFAYRPPMLNVLLPVGISFYTFQTLAYAIDVYRGNQKPERHLGIFALYVSFFPQLVAGPIERSRHLLPQLHTPQPFNERRVISGLQLMFWGFFKKLVIADRLALYVNAVYNEPESFQGLPVILATYFFAYQIYCDFSGYSDIAIGSARIMGYDLMENFRRPYFSKSISEFWQRWHISLSTWFRDYLYIPLGGNRVVRWRWYTNLLIVFLTSGLWHGANWTFLVWGALHGGYLVTSILTQGWRDGAWNAVVRLVGPSLPMAWRSRLPRLRQLVAMGVTFHLVVFAWVFFRANSLGDALILLRNGTHLDFARPFMNIAMGSTQFIAAVLSIGVLEGIHLLQRRRSLGDWLGERPVWLRGAAYSCGILIILFFGEFGASEFIYFQF